MCKYLKYFSLLIISALLLVLPGCASGDEALAALPSLVERAEVLNGYIWGYGPELEDYEEPTLSTTTSKYVRVAETAEYTTLADLTEAILQVYSTDYCELIIEIVLEGSDDAFARYNEDNTDGRLTFEIINEGFELRTKLDPSRAEVKSTGFNRVIVEMPCTFDGVDDGMYEVEMVWENGSWKLDSPTY